MKFFWDENTLPPNGTETGYTLSIRQYMEKNEEEALPKSSLFATGWRHSNLLTLLYRPRGEDEISKGKGSGGVFVLVLGGSVEWSIGSETY